jgi:tetratricopeptide (TPR) repeat protein
MAPEQQHGQAADARADQFSFCVTLHEAVCGAHPFLPRPSSPSSPSSPPSRDRRRVPVWLQRAVQRGLAERPDDRHPGMDSLLRALVQTPVRRRRRIQLVAAAAAVALVGAGVTAYGLSGRRDDALCAGAASQLAGIWNPGTRAEIAAAFAATKLPYALDAWRRAAPILDGYAAQWSAMHTEACRATRVRGEQSELLMDRRMACLDVDRRELDQLTRLLLHPDADIVEHAVQAAHGLGRIQGCGDLAALIRRVAPPPDPVAAARVSAVRAQLAQVRVLHAAGKYADGLARVAPLAAEPIVIDYLPLRAEIAYATGQLHASRAEWQLALTSLQDAIWAAEASGHDEIAVAALAGAVTALADLDRFKEADDTIRRGEAALLRSAAAPPQRAEFRASVCHARDREARYPEARDQCQQVLDLRLGALDSDHPDVAIAMFHLGELANRDEHGDSNEQALGYFRRALAIEDKALGPEHPELQRTLTAMAEAELRLGRLDDALVHDRRALGIAERAFGADSMRVFRVLWSLGDVLRLLQRPAEAVEVDRRALAIAERAVGPEHSQTALAHLRVGDALQDLIDYAGALQHYQRAEATLAATVGTSHPNYGIAVLDVCSMQLELKRPRQALQTCTLSLDVLERALGRGAPAVADALVRMIDRVYAANGMMREALAAIERGIASWPKGDPTAPAKLAEGELTLAQTIWEYVPSERARARSLAIRARDRLRDAGPDRAAQRDAAAAWLAAHR